MKRIGWIICTSFGVFILIKAMFMAMQHQLMPGVLTGLVGLLFFSLGGRKLWEEFR